MKALHLQLLPAVGMALLATTANAQVFTYNDQDVLLGFRPAAGNAAAGTLLVNLGPVTQFENATPGLTFAVGNTAAVNSTFTSLANLSYSVSAANKTGTPNPIQSIWVSRPRTDLGTQTSPYSRQGASALANTATVIASLAASGVAVGGISGSIDTSTQVILVSDASHQVGKFVGSTAAGGGTVGNFQSKFAGGNAEKTTPSVFTISDTVRSDFYEILPGSGASTYLGYFEFSGNGSTTFTAVPEPETYAVLAGAALVGFGLWRRRSLVSLR